MSPSPNQQIFDDPGVDAALVREGWTARNCTPTGVRLEDGEMRLYLRYHLHRDDEPQPDSVNPLGALLKLAQLEGQTLADRVERFARRHGVIPFCECGRPWWPCVHHIEETKSRARRVRSTLGKRAHDWQKVQWYADLAALFQAIIQLSQRVSHRRRAEPNDALTFYRGVQRDIAEWELAWRCQPDVLRQELELHINNWLDNARCTIQLDWSAKGRASVVIGQPSPLARLVYALARRVYAQPYPTVLCAGPCGRWIRKQRQPKSGTSSWCDRDECRKAKDRQAQQRRKARLAAGELVRRKDATSQ